ncbi:MAG TPA: putative sulfate exporter family transporter [Gemmatimonadaceae bacterium]
MWNWFKRLLPGIAISIVVGFAAIAAGMVEAKLFGRAIIEPLVLAILIGMVIRTARGESTAQAAGVRFVAKDVLEFAICLLGATMDVPRLFASGPVLALGIVGLVVTALSLGYVIGRASGLTPNLAILVATGNAICGNSAIAAVAPVIGAEREDVVASIALTAVLGVIAVLGLPLLMIPLGFSNYQYGLLAGLTVYAVPQVLAAAFAVSTLSGQVATAVKLARVLMLGPVVTFFALRGRKRAAQSSSNATASKKTTLVPWFVIGFVILATLRSVGVVPDVVADGAKLIAGWLTIGAMAALGLSSDLRTVKRVGARVAIAVAGSLSALMILAIVFIKALKLH